MISAMTPNATHVPFKDVESPADGGVVSPPWTVAEDAREEAGRRTLAVREGTGPGTADLWTALEEAVERASGMCSPARACQAITA